ncbi:hypothetical protein [Nocardia fluminea]|uniref:Uncharacterized protein n=1 Tax=Nocardia fluminea TaxID=134984 RepID=A0A2N3VGW8_9NOCA|nr:hypothetical protein [Nocardia fluminea]PKV80871.1 hypothetical protein ATK86_5308 [Nocardia fluminea]
MSADHLGVVLAHIGADGQAYEIAYDMIATRPEELAELEAGAAELGKGWELLELRRPATTTVVEVDHNLAPGTPCRSCSQPIAWYRTPAWKRIPLDLAPSRGGNIVIDGGVAVALSADALADSDPSVPRYLSHFATCPDAKSWRGNGGQS